MVRKIVHGASLLGALGAMSAMGAGCLDRPISANLPTTQTNFTTAVQETTVEKVDLLFDIDNSASMGDKQAYLEQAVPDLISRLVSPNCIQTGQSPVASVLGVCPMGYALEFPPVHDMHIGVISSSLGSRGGDLCDPSAMTNQGQPFLDGSPAISAHNDDRGELIARASNDAETETTLADTGGQSFLDWFPTGASWPANAGLTATEGPQALSPAANPLTVAGPATTTGSLEYDFAELINGVHFYGCGIESQLESFYRFLVQPDPYDSIVVSTGGQVSLQGVDATIIQQRHDFLRPDSLVAVIVLSDENDSEIDVRAYGGLGSRFMSTGFSPWRATAACAKDPASPDCTSCDAQGSGEATDPSCQMNGGVYPTSAVEDWGYDPNLRHVHMKQKYGIDPQYPLQRYVLGLTSPTVPDRDHEYPAGAYVYQGGTAGDPADLDCTNPLFAASLPDGSDLSPEALCNKTGAGGSRTASNVFFAHIGGVPHQLLQVDPTNPDSAQKDSLSSADWQKILGQNPDAYDYTGIDPHMIEDYAPRTQAGLPFPMAASSTGGGPDPINGREWVTNTGPASQNGNAAVSTTQHVNLYVDREYACIFQLPTPRDCSNLDDFVNQDACDCSTKGLPQEAVPPVCGIGAGGDYNEQLYAKAYPTIRELTLAKLMGDQGIVSSLCPIHTVDQEGGHDPLYGYRPAITAIVDRLKNALANECVPDLDVDGSGQVPCLVLATLDSGTASAEEAACNQPSEGLSVPEASVLAPFQQKQHQAWVAQGGHGSDPSTFPTCQVAQIAYDATGSCTAGDPANQGWCYVTSASGSKCQHALQFTAHSLPNGATATMQCIAAAVPVVGR
jgi:hypothetical protein